MSTANLRSRRQAEAKRFKRRVKPPGRKPSGYVCGNPECVGLVENRSPTEELWWLDFQPRLGTFITMAYSIQDAARKASALGCNPGDCAVAGWLYPLDIGKTFQNRLLSWDEAEALMRSFDGNWPLVH
jgi:hypothetical protein